jgi:mycofactocin precursor
MKSSDDRVALAERARKDADKEEARCATETASKEEKPRTSGEIVIEEISIDGMCGVY